MSEGFEMMKEYVARRPYQISMLQEKQGHQESREMLAAAGTVSLGTQGRSGNYKLLDRAGSKQTKPIRLLPFYIMHDEVLGIVMVHQAIRLRTKVTVWE